MLSSFNTRHSSSMKLFALAFGLCISPLVGSPLLLSQTQSTASVPDPASVLQVTSRLVVLDVVVTDAAGKPIDPAAANLTAKDFQVFEDDKLQRIRSVEAPSLHTLPAATLAAGSTAVFNPAEPESFGLSPVNVLILDQLNTHFADSTYARRSLHDYLAKQPLVLPQPTTLLSVYDNRFTQLQGFTRDRDALLRSLAAAPTKYAWELEVNGKAEHGPLERLDQSLHALEQIAQSYARIPGRKNLIWVGSGFPSIDPDTTSGDEAREIKDTLQHITDVLLDTRVTLYAIDPSSTAAGITEITDATQMAFVQAGDSGAHNIDPFGATDDFDSLGPVTGGRIIRGRNDIDKLIASSIDLGANFYTLSYSPSSVSDTAAKFRKIKVLCLRPGYSATTRGGYYSGVSQQQKSTASAGYDLSTASEGTMPLNGLHVKVEADATMPETWVIHVSAPELTWKPNSEGGSTASVYVMAVSLNAKGRMISHTLHGMKAVARAGTDLHDPARSADFFFTAAPANKSTTLRFIVRDSATGRMGLVDLPLTKH